MADKRLKQLANRLGPDAKRLRMKVHGQIPWPKEPERIRLKFLEAQSEAESWRSLYKLTVERIDRNEDLIETYKRKNADNRKEAMHQIQAAGKWAEEANRIKKSL